MTSRDSFSSTNPAEIPQLQWEGQPASKARMPASINGKLFACLRASYFFFVGGGTPSLSLNSANFFSR